MANTYNTQTAKFLAKVAENMPSLSSDVMQGWIENPKALKEALRVLMPPDILKVERNMILARSHLQRFFYAWCDSSVEKVYPEVIAEHVGEWEWQQFPFKQDTTFEEAVRLMKVHGYEPGHVCHLVALQMKKCVPRVHMVVLGSEFNLDGRPRWVASWWRDESRIGHHGYHIGFVEHPPEVYYALGIRRVNLGK